MQHRLILSVLFFLSTTSLFAEDGYRLWMRYNPISDASLQKSYDQALGTVHFSGESDTLTVAKQELTVGLKGLLGELNADGSIIFAGSISNLPEGIQIDLSEQVKKLGKEGYLITRTMLGDESSIVITANSDIGVLYGVFAFLRHLQTHQSLELLPISSTPRITHRLLNHWDNLTRTTERAQAGQSLWEWFQLPDYVSPRYQDYARANASIGINGTVLTNVNANARVLTTEYIQKAAALADVFRPYGIKVYLTARFSAPIEIGGLSTADPLNPEVQIWWNEKVTEIYQLIPDFGGFLVKANSEGQPGPQEYGRNHTDGANMFADALAPHGGIVMWRAFVYSHNSDVDRHKQAYDEFVPLDGSFRENVIIQVKNGPIDFMPREPFHPMFGAMPKTSLALELQITQEYLGGAVHLAYLSPLFKEALDNDTFTSGPGSTVGRVIDGSINAHSVSVIAGVSNIGTNRNWTGHPLAQSNWYAFGRLAWDHQLESRSIAEEWTAMTFSNNPSVISSITEMLMESREAVVNYSMPLGLHHIMAKGHHYGPGPWVDQGRADWTSVYYHRADQEGLGFDRTMHGSTALDQYATEIQEKWGDPQTIPSNLLLWFHHVPWDFDMPGSHRPLWEELGYHYQQGVDTVRSWKQLWQGLNGSIDKPRYTHVLALLTRQEREAIEYKDACLLYFQTFAQRSWPQAAEPALHSLEYYKSLKRYHVSGNPAEM